MKCNILILWLTATSMHSKNYVNSSLFIKSFSADVFGQDGALATNCNSLDQLIQSRNTARVSNCRKADNCLSITCNISGIGDEASAEISFSACSKLAGVRLNFTTATPSFFGVIETMTSRTAKSSSNTAIQITNTKFLDISLKQISAGINFGVSITVNIIRDTCRGINLMLHLHYSACNIFLSAECMTSKNYKKNIQQKATDIYIANESHYVDCRPALINFVCN